MPTRILWLFLAGGWFLGSGDGPVAEQPKAPPDPPFKRLLRGADARRAADLDRQVHAATAAGRLKEAQAAAGQLVALRTRKQGADHWQTIDARWLHDTLKKIASLSARDRQELHRAGQVEREGHRLKQENRLAQAEACFQKALALRRKILGEDHPHTATSYHHLAGCLYEQGK